MPYNASGRSAGIAVIRGEEVNSNSCVLPRYTYGINNIA